MTGNTPLKLISMSEINAEEVQWLWYPYIPLGKLTIIQGDPGEGKTSFILAVIAALTRGEPLPEYERAAEPMNVIYQTAEDGLADTIKPRLESAGADCTRVLVIDEGKRELTLCDARLEEAIRRTGAKLIVLDPLQAYLGSDVDMHRANEVRPVLKRLSMMAERTQCAVILIGHMNKAQGLKSGYRGLGSIDFRASARSVLIVGRLKSGDTLRIVAQDKNSLAPEGSSIAFELHPECESIVEPQEEGGESEGGEDVEEQTGAGTDVRSRLDVRFGLQPVEKDLNRLPQGTDAGGHGIFRNKNIVLFPLSRRDERDVPLGLQMGSPFCVDIGTICIEPAVCDRCAVQIDLLCSPQVAETGFADLYGAGNGKLMRPQLGKNMQLDAVVPQVFRGISC